MSKLALFAMLLAGISTMLGCGGLEVEEGSNEPRMEQGKADTASSPTTITVTEAQNGQTITAQVGDTVDIRLWGNPTTGYAWNVVASSKSLPVTSESYIPDQTCKNNSSKCLVGSGGTYSFILQPTFLAAGGKHVTQLAYYRSWEGPAAAINTFSVTISVPKAKQGVKCGPTTCKAGDVCCNESCGICTPPGGFCIELFCAPTCKPACSQGEQCVECKTISGSAWVCLPDGTMC
jgi:predicted secreted protein